MKNADQFIDELERQELVPEEITRRLRRKASSASGGLSAQSVAKYLVKKEFITAEVAGKLLVAITKDDRIERSEKTPTLDKGPDPAEKPELSEPLATDPLEQAAAEADSGGVSVAEEAGKYGSRRHKHLKKAKGNEFDSPLMLIGGCALALLLLVGGGLFYLLSTESGDELLNNAESSFQSQSYSQSIAEFERFIKDFPTHGGFSKAKVMLAVARLRQAVETNGDFELSLGVAEEVIPTIEDEPEFGIAQGDLASLLPRIAKGLAEKAEFASESETPEDAGPLVEKTQAALTFVGNTKYVPKSLRDDADLAVIREILARIERREESRKDLVETIAGMSKATDGGDPREAYVLHTSLLKKRQELRSDEKLLEALTTALNSEQGSIRYVQESTTAATDDRESGVLTTVASATQRVEGTAKAEGVFVTIQGGVAYGLDARQGKLLWRRPVGVGTKVVQPVYVDNDILLVDHRYNELLRLSGTNGTLQWRIELGDAINAPVLSKDQILATVESGRLFVIDPSSGAQQGYINFAQSLRGAPCVDTRSKRIYLAGEHSSLYTINSNTFECLGVTYVGHSPGSIQTQPLLITSKLVLVENTGLESSVIRVHRLDESGIADEQIALERLEGVCYTKPQALGRRLFVATDAGEARLYEFTVDSGSDPMSLLALRPAGRQERGPRYLSANRLGLWIADQGIGRFVPSIANKRLVSQQIGNPCPADSFAGPLVENGQTLLHTRRRMNVPGLFVAATDTKSGKIIWETHLGIQPAGLPFVSNEPRGVFVADMLGSHRVLTRENISSKVSNDSNPIIATKAFDQLTPLGSGQFVFTGLDRADYQIVSADSQVPNKDDLFGPLASEVTTIGESWLAPLLIGQIHCFDNQGNPSAAPFQPPLSPGQEIRWLPLGTGQVEGQNMIVAATQDGELFALELTQGGSPELAMRSTATVGDFPVSRGAIAGGHGLFILKSGKIGLFGLPELTEPKLVDPESRVVWGPFAVGDLAIMATESSELIAVDPTQSSIAWRVPLESGMPVGKPLLESDTLTLVTEGGQCLSFAPASGELQGSTSLGELPGSGPSPYGDRLLIYANDSTLLVIKRP